MTSGDAVIVLPTLAFAVVAYWSVLVDCRGVRRLFAAWFGLSCSS
jgi:hypothetical protein